MELDAVGELRKAMRLTEKCNKLIGEMRTIENRKKTLQAEIVESALGNESEGNASKEIIGLEKVLEAMEEKLNHSIKELGEQMKTLRSIYREKAEKYGLGVIAEAVPQ